MLEADLQDAVIDTARLLGWRVAHFRPARTEKGWRTPVAADGKGFPDLVMVRRERLIFAELKAAGEKLRAEQVDWLAALEHADCELYVWRPIDWTSGEIEGLLR
jgi:VRR-NUC domain